MVLVSAPSDMVFTTTPNRAAPPDLTVNVIVARWVGEGLPLHGDHDDYDVKGRT
jgi:hypothetical protein